MATFIFANNIETTLAGGISSASTSLTLSSTQNLPSSIPAGSYLVLTLNDQATRTNYEIVYVTAISGATLTVLRGQESTAAKAWLTGDYAFSGPTAGQMANFAQNASTGVTPGTYGSSTQVPQFTVNAQGQVTAASNVAIAFPITSFNGRAGAIVLNSGDVTSALGYNPVNKAGDTMTGALTISQTSTLTCLTLQNTSSNGGILKMIGDGSTTPSKYIRARASLLEILSDGGSQLAQMTDAGVWTFNNILNVNGTINLLTTTAAVITASTNSSNSSNIVLANTSSAGRSWTLFSAGSAGIGSAGAGSVGLYDNTGGALRFWIDTNGASHFVTQGQFATVAMQDTGAQGINIQMTGNGATTPSKYIRAINGQLQFVNSSYSSVVTTMDDSGNWSFTGTGNFNTSDRDLKQDIEVAEPQPLHRLVPFTSYKWRESLVRGRGPIAQDVLAAQPLYVGTYKDIKDVDRLSVNKVDLALEEAFWAGQELDRLRARVFELELVVNGGA